MSHFDHESELAAPQRRSPVPFPLRDVTAATAQADNRRLASKMSPAALSQQQQQQHAVAAAYGMLHQQQGSAPVSPVMGSPAAAALQFAALQAAAFAAAATMSSLSHGLSPVGVVPLPASAGFPVAPLGLPMSASFGGSMTRLDGVSPTNSEYRRIRQNDPYSASVLPAAFEEQAALSRAESVAMLTAGNSPTSCIPLPVPWEASDLAAAAIEQGHSFCAPQPAEPSTTTTSSLVKSYLNGRPTVSPKTSPSKQQPEPTLEQLEAAASAAASSPPTATPMSKSSSHGNAGATPIKKWHAVVAFRQRTGVFVVDAIAPLSAIGSYVMVQGDRGIDMGKVLRVATSEEAAEAQSSQEGDHRVIRVANPAEINKWAALVRDEATALENVKKRTKEILGDIPDFEIHAVEYQFDRLKLFVYYTCGDRVYFVPLLKALNATYHCRIWMELLPAKSQAHHHTTIGHGQVMPLTGGTVTIGNRPQSEFEMEQLSSTKRRGAAGGRSGKHSATAAAPQ